MGALLVDISINAPITKVSLFPYKFLTDSSALALRSVLLFAEQQPREFQRERAPDGQKRRELPLERRFGADVVSRLNPPSQFRNSRSFKVSKPRRQ